MSIRAKTNPKYLAKFLLIGICALAYGLWNLYDASFTYPAAMPIAEAYEKLDAEIEEDGEVQRRWAEMTAENGWAEEVPESVANLQHFTNYNYFIGAVFTFLIGVPCLLFSVFSFGGWFEADKEGLTNRKGQSVRFDQITKIDKTKWEKKGITKLEYDDNGVAKKFVIDDLKFDRAAADQIMRLVEDNVGDKLIEGGKSEAEYERIKAEIAAEKAARDAEELAELEAENQN